MTDEPRSLDDLLDDLFRGHERLTRDDIQRSAVAQGLSPQDLTRLDRLPEGEYAQDEVVDALAVLDD